MSLVVAVRQCRCLVAADLATLLLSYVPAQHNINCWLADSAVMTILDRHEVNTA